jgi:predicted alpha/beta-fold hydrolase
MSQPAQTLQYKIATLLQVDRLFNYLEFIIFGIGLGSHMLACFGFSSHLYKTLSKISISKTQPFDSTIACELHLPISINPTNPHFQN